ncbi:hypothetical protein Tco_0786759, partial [Tanacetum coccineum]
MESYYSQIYKLDERVDKEQLQVSPMQVNDNFLQQLQPEWSRLCDDCQATEQIDIRLISQTKGHDEEIDEQELEAHYSYMAKIQEVSPAESSSTDTPLEQISSNTCTNDNPGKQNEYKAIKETNASLTQELKSAKQTLMESSRALGEATSSRDSSLIALQTKQTELEKYTALNDLTSDYKILQTKLNDTLGLLAIKNIDISVVNQKHDELVKKSLLNKSQFEGQLKEKTKVISDLKVKEGKDIDTMIEMEKQIKFLNEILYKRNQSIQTIHMLAPKCATYHGRSTFANPKYCKQAQSNKPCLYQIPYDTSDPANRFAPDGEEIVTLSEESRSKLDKDKSLPQNRNQAVRNTNVLKPGMFRIASTTTQTRTPQLPHASRNTNPHMSKSSGVIHTTSVSRPQLKSYQVKDKVVPNISQVKFTKKEVEDNHRISSISKKTKSVTACNDSSNSRTSNANAVCADCGKCVFNSDHDACVSRYLKDVNARTKKPKVVPISASKPKRKANKSVATPHKKTVAPDTTIQKSKSYYKELYENTNQEWKWWIAKRCPSSYTWTQKPLKTKKIWIPKIRKANESTSISPTIDIVSRITNVLKISNSLGSNLSNVPSSSNSLADFQASVVNVKWRLLKITLQAPFLNVQMTFEHSSSSLGHQCQMTFEHSSSSLGRQCQMVSAENNTSGPNSEFKTTAMNSSKSCSLSKQDSYITTRVGITIPPSYSNAEDNRTVLALESRPGWLFDIDLLTNSMNYEPVTATNQTNRNAEDAVVDDASKKTNEKPTNKEGYATSTNRISTLSPAISAAGQSFDNANDLPTDPIMPDLEDTTDLLNTGIFCGAYDDED